MATECSKNGSNELNFGPDLHFNGFYRFLKEFFKNFENFRPKNGHFLRFSRSFSIVNCLRKMYLVCGKCSNQSDIWHTHAPRYPLKMLVCRILIFCLKIEFLVILCTSGAIFAIFWRKKLKICPRGA